MRMDPKTDVKEIVNTWRWDVETWMKSSTLEKYRQYEENGKRNDAQQLGKKSFSTYIFHLSGRKHLLHKLLEFPVIAMSQDSYPGSEDRSPAIFTEFVESLLNDLFTFAELGWIRLAQLGIAWLESVSPYSLSSVHVELPVAVSTYT